MRLLNTRTAKLHSSPTSAGLRYAILSHVWQTDEQSLQDVQALDSRRDAMEHVSAKIRRCCEVALEDGYEWVWIDTCCIDKTSSSELSEAINSMYAWYANATICYAYLYDISDSVEDITAGPAWEDRPTFRSSRWFTRGWTLQELIAPAYLVFLSASWSVIGTKQTLANTIEEVTGIPHDILVHACSLSTMSVARRMSWASKRETTREEDRAYSLMGIFGIHMPTIYGEGRNSFFRLQEEILKRSPDQTIFAWGTRVVGDPLSSFTYIPKSHWPPSPPPHHLFASSPADFEGMSRITSLSYSDLATLLRFRWSKLPEFRLTSYGVRAELPIIREASFTDNQEELCYAILSCQDEEGNIGMLLLRIRPSAFHECVVGTYSDTIGISNLSYATATNYWRVVFVPLGFAQSLAAQCELMEVHISSLASELTAIPVPRNPVSAPGNASAPPTYAFFVSNYTLAQLAPLGLHVVQGPAAQRDGIMIVPSADAPASFTLRPHNPGNIRVIFRDPHKFSVTVTAGARCTARKLGVLALRRDIPAWLAVEVHHCRPGEEGITRTVLPPRSGFVGSGAKGCRDAHIPAPHGTGVCAMEFGDDGSPCAVALRLQRWEKCHRSRAEFVFMLEISVAGADVDVDPAPPRRV
ncbi:heterokaryon incompatibility protein-domain-containing protein [Daedaleopsis nitida]|nr:heterokaryon incompatibility protein-domain-containing protein [Daedaleopsis nitida]